MFGQLLKFRTKMLANFWDSGMQKVNCKYVCQKQCMLRMWLYW